MYERKIELWSCAHTGSQRSSRPVLVAPEGYRGNVNDPPDYIYLCLYFLG